MKLGEYILAASETDGIFKLVIGIVVGAIWLIGAIMSASKKKNPGEQKDKSWEQILRDLTGETGPKPQEPPPLPQVRQPGGKRAVVKKGAKRMVAPTVVAQPLEKPVVMASTEDAYSKGEISATEIGSAGAAAKLRAERGTAGAIGEWLKPGTLRRQWILTEILLPPVSLRK